MKDFPKKIYVTMSEEDDCGISEYFVNEDTKFIVDEDADTEVAVYQLLKTGRIVKSSKIVFE